MYAACYIPLKKPLICSLYKLKPGKTHWLKAMIKGNVTNVNFIEYLHKQTKGTKSLANSDYHLQYQNSNVTACTINNSK